MARHRKVQKETVDHENFDAKDVQLVVQLVLDVGEKFISSIFHVLIQTSVIAFDSVEDLKMFYL